MVPTLRVSVLMPMRNAAPFVSKALRSIINEQQVPLEVVVVDDRSTDGSRAAVASLEDPRIRVIDGEGRGISAALNKALWQSRGDIVMRCDADDAYPAERITTQLSWLDSHPEFGATCGAFVAMDPRGRTKVPLRMAPVASEITDELRNGLVRTHFCTYAIRSAVLKEIGGARSFFATAEDIDMQLRLGEVCRVWYSPAILYHYRIHDASITHSVRSSDKQYYDALALRLQQQRREKGLDDLQRGQLPDGPGQSGTIVDSAAAHLQSLLIGDMWTAFDNRQPAKALKAGVRAVVSRPTSINGWRQLFIAASKLMLAKMRL